MSASDALAMLLAEGRETAPSEPVAPPQPETNASAPADEPAADSSASGDAPAGKLPSAAEALKMLQNK